MKEITVNYSIDNASWRDLSSSVWRRPLSYILVLFCFLFSISHLTDYTFDAVRYQSPSDTYGPVPMVSDNSSYNYFKFESSFKSIPIDRINEIDKKEFRKLIMLSIPRHLKKRFRPYLAHTLEIAEKYEVDPFWVLAIMWTESHFNIKAKSYVSATGLMQIMPGTGRFLARLMKRPHSHKIAMELVKDPKTNIEMGAFYLKRLVRSFDHNYRLATVAYNMGPGGVRSRIRRNLPVGVRNNYLDKVTGFHKKLTAPFTKAVLSTKRPYMSTFVIKRYHRAETISLKSFFKKLDSYIMPRGVRYAALKSQIFLL